MKKMLNIVNLSFMTGTVSTNFKPGIGKNLLKNPNLYPGSLNVYQPVSDIESAFSACYFTETALTIMENVILLTKDSDSTSVFL